MNKRLLKELISSNDLEEAFSLAEDYLEIHKKELILLKNRYSQLKKRKIKGSISTQEAEVIHSRIVESFLDLIDLPESQNSGKKRTVSVIIGILLIGFTLVGLGVFWFISNPSSSLDKRNSLNPEPRNPSIQPYKAELKTIIVPRWGFMFYYPEHWDREEPDNGDGFGFTYPLEPDIYIIGAGAYTSSTGCEMFCYEEVSLTKSFILAKDSATTFLFEGESSKWLIEDPQKAAGTDKRSLEGYKFVYTHQDVSGKKWVTYHSFTIHEGIKFSLYAGCPIERKGEFEDLFQQVSSTFYVIRKSSP